MQPFINPYLFSNPIYGNYGQQMSQNVVTQPMQTVGISGRYVNDFSEINASDIPMNSPAIFAKADKSEIQLREWNANGQITTKVYKTVVPRNVRLSEAPSHGEPVLYYDNKSKGAQVYMELAREVIDNE